MEIIGNILKETTRIGYQRRQKRAERREIQLRTLSKLIKKSKNTAFGTAHHFDKISSSKDLVVQFQTAVPITNYANFYEKWLHRTIEGEKDVIWPGKIGYFALSSGTSVGSSKQIPVSDNMLRKFQRSTIQQIAGLYKLQLPASFYESNVLIIGGSTDLKKVNKAYHGDLSGILAKNKSIVVAPFTKPSPRIAKLRNWDEKVEAIIEMAPSWDIGVIAGVPSWVSQLLERIIQRYQLKSIHDIWPNLRLYSHGGIFLKPYEERLSQLFGQPMIYQNTYLASEGYFAYQRDFVDGGMQLMLSNGIFYEFVEEENFHLLKTCEAETIPTLTIDQVKENTPYAMVISTCSGLWRYSLGDTIEFTNVESRTLQITGRISFHLSLYGEHLSDANMMAAIQLLSQEMNVAIEEFTVHADKETNCHYWYLGTTTLLNEGETSSRLDELLVELNDDYASVRKYLLKAPKVRILPTQTFYKFMELNQKIGGQHKFPHVLTNEQNGKWEAFLNE